jgi:2-methylisocitrate lyase-like PEP mutase family enzyme
MRNRPSLRALLEQHRFIVAPGVYDGISACFAAQHGFDALYMTGHGVSMSSLGIPDIGTATYSEMVKGVQVITGVTDIPLIADGDTGYGALLNVERTVRGYEAAGAAAIQIEDQAFPKKCGHTPGRVLIETEEMVKKIRVAVDTRASREFMIVVRTDARSSHGLDEALRRGERYFAAGADILFVESPESEEELHKIGSTLDGYLLVNEVEGGRTPILPAETLKDMGFNIAIYPGTAMFSAAEMYRRLYGHIAQHRTSAGCEVPIMHFDEWCRTIGFPAAWEFEAKYGAQH